MDRYDVLVIGAGFAGAVVAQQLAQSKKVLVIEKRPQIGGNMFESLDSSGVSVHWYGPHIFHTNSEKVFSYLSEFCKWNPYEHKVLGSIDEKLVPIPFNYTSLEKLMPDKASFIKDKLTAAFTGQGKVSVHDLIQSDDQDIKEVGQFVYEKVFMNYTAKQWGVDPHTVDKSVINRVPVVLGYDDRYFGDKFQYMPVGGFTQIFENMLNHKNITVELNQDALSRISINVQKKQILFDGSVWSGEVVYTGAVDELFCHCHGMLPYRSIDFCFEQHDVEFFQPAAVVNYPNDQEFTRITEFKYLSNQTIDRTTTLKEYPKQHTSGSEPYYPIVSAESARVYNLYKQSANEIKNLHLCGRLAEYKYYNMDAVIDAALKLSDEIKQSWTSS